MKNDLEIISKNRLLLFGCATIMVFILHMWLCLFNENSYIGYLELNMRSFGNYGVDIFIILSGLGCYYSLCKNNTKKFYINRIKKIGFAFIAIALINNILNHNNIIDFIKDITLFNFFFKSVYNGSWFTSAVILLYIFAPLYFLIFQRSKNKTIFTIVFITISLIILSITNSCIRPDFTIFTKRIPEFIIGMWLGWYIKNKKFSMTKKFNYSITIILITAWIIESIIILSSNYIYFVNSILTTTIGICITIKLSYILEKVKNKKVLYLLSLCGSLSYEIYRVQECKLYYIILDYLVPKNIETMFNLFIIKLLLNISSFAIAILLGYIIYKLKMIILQMIENKHVDMKLLNKRITNQS